MMLLYNIYIGKTLLIKIINKIDLKIFCVNRLYKNVAFRCISSKA